MANHPWVKDVSTEIEKLEKEQEASGEAFNTIPIEKEEIEDGKEE